MDGQTPFELEKGVFICNQRRSNVSYYNDLVLIFFQNAIIGNTHRSEQNKLLYLGLIQLNYQRSMLIMAVLVSSYNSLVSGLEEYLQT